MDFNSKNILVVGDVMVDCYYKGESTRISPEAPVPVFKKTSEYSVLGGAANVAANLIAAGQKVSIMSVVGNDIGADTVESLFGQCGVDTSLLIRDTTRKTTTKTRILGQNSHQMLRIDIEDTTEINETIANKLLLQLESCIDGYDIIVLSDYLKGVLSGVFTREIISMARRVQKKVLVDVKDSHIEKYSGAFLLKPNLNELRILTQMAVTCDAEIEKAAVYLKDTSKCEYVLVTLGSQGMMLIDEFKKATKIPCVAREVFDVTGAGDTVISYLAAAMSSNVNALEAVKLANYAAGVKVSKVGTATVTPQEVMRFKSECERPRIRTTKILSMKNAKSFFGNTCQKKVVFTNGCFDILHAGHLNYLRQAATLGDIFIIGVNSDASVQRLKGLNRPIMCLEDRMELLAALEFVDYVIAFEEDTPYEIITVIKPDILVKGGDYLPENVIGKDIVQKNGGQVVIIPLVEGKSTTSIVKKIRDRYGE